MPYFDRALKGAVIAIALPVALVWALYIRYSGERLD